MKSCLSCGCEAKKALSSSWFWVFVCKGCGKKYCEKCGPPCPGCDSDNTIDVLTSLDEAACSFSAGGNTIR